MCDVAQNNRYVEYKDFKEEIQEISKIQRREDVLPNAND